MTTKTSSGKGICKCGAENWTEVIKTIDSATNKTLEVVVTVCSKEDRTACAVCGTIDWSGKLPMCCGKAMLENPFEKKK